MPARPLTAPSLFAEFASITLAGVPDGAEALALARVVDDCTESGPKAIFVARDSERLRQMRRALGFFRPDIATIALPGWDCLPYDRVSPTPAVVAERMTALAELLAKKADERAFVLMTTVNAFALKVPPRATIARSAFSAAPGNRIDMAELAVWLENNGFSRAGTVRDTGDYAVRGGILDLYPPGFPAPLRLDFFGDALESIRSFDPESQRSQTQLHRLDLVPMSEVRLDADSIRQFRQAYVAAFGAARNDPLYEAISEGRRYAGLEHWLPLFEPDLVPVVDYAPLAPIVLDPLADDALAERLTTIEDYYQARRTALADSAGGAPYHPVEPASLYLTKAAITAILASRPVARLTPFVPPPQGDVVDLGGRVGRNFAAERIGGANVFDALVSHLKELDAAGRRVILASWTEGSRERMAQVIADHGLTKTEAVGTLAAARGLKPRTLGLAVLGVESGFEIDDLVVVAEQDVLGDRMARGARRKRKADSFLTEAAGLAEGDHVVHVDHGIGCFVGLKTIVAAGAPHDCLEIAYAGGDKLFLPVENIELLSRYGSDTADVQLDRLGGGAWQARKARMKNRIRVIAAELIQTAAGRLLKAAPVLMPAEGMVAEFAARFPYDETEDQLAAIEAVAGDLAAGKPMDRLVCGDVGFGKTEVALRAAFFAAMSGRQVAVVVPTTLLARQHFRTFSERFRGLPVRIEQASRLVSAKDLATTRAGLADGTVDIVVGTHALLAPGIRFRDLGLLVIDEEQHFGVKHKERLKELKVDVHVLTLSATPIPRTLQLALTGVRDLSLIATPPVDRLAVRSFVTPLDPLTVREALLREHYRGGQAFYVCPRVSDLAERKDFLDRVVPEVKVGIAHGQMPPGQLEDIMNAFYDRQFDVLLSTTIVESGLDIPTANTMIVHRADMFGLGQLYQLKGRVGRAKTRAYALFTTPADKKLTGTAERRLKVLQSLETLGAGFQLATHDLDIRGAGNLVGDEQSGHIKEVGYELYQQMLQEAVATLKAGGIDAVAEDQWSPQITVGTPVLIPESYVPDLGLRLGLYRRLADLTEQDDIDAFAAELHDRFGALPAEVDHLMKIVTIKALCRRANVDKVEAGPKGIVLSFRDGIFTNPAALVHYVAEQGVLARIRPDQRIVLSRDWPEAEQRLKGTASVLVRLVKMAEDKSTPQKLVMPVSPPPPPPLKVEPAKKPARRWPPVRGGFGGNVGGGSGWRPRGR